MTIDHSDADRLQLLDRIEARLPDLKIEQRELEWRTLPDGAEALFVNGGGVDGGDGVFVANAGEDVTVIGSLRPLAAAIGCIVVKPDGTRILTDLRPDPYAGQEPADS